MIQKTFWYLMLGLSVTLFVMTIVSNNFWLLFGSLGLAFVVRIKGNKVLFGAYDQKRKEKIERIKKLRAKKSGA
ncbi:hypothetical protein [Sporolactobacillus laevolacticus]|uniref:hypothetical protein n=1 Tax=Sporolactobacillus laevolacticus TaxID=33018 RepID=UPI0025B59CDA|nr:hypothetical protein [Sporolactobacillus laevolacticus]MDN3954798.1 hypothetical protein [Sporolactobacillus laevolacticus]